MNCAHVHGEVVGDRVRCDTCGADLGPLDQPEDRRAIERATRRRPRHAGGG